MMKILQFYSTGNQIAICINFPFLYPNLVLLFQTSMLNKAKELRLGCQWNRDIKSSAFASILFPMQLMAPLNLRAYSNALILILEHL